MKSTSYRIGLREFAWGRTEATFQQHVLNRPPLTEYYKKMNNFRELIDSQAPHKKIRQAYGDMEESGNAVDAIFTFASYWQGFKDGLTLLKYDPLDLYDVEDDK